MMKDPIEEIQNIAEKFNEIAHFVRAITTEEDAEDVNEAIDAVASNLDLITIILEDYLCLLAEEDSDE